VTTIDLKLLFLCFSNRIRSYNNKHLKEIQFMIAFKKFKKFIFFTFSQSKASMARKKNLRLLYCIPLERDLKDLSVDTLFDTIRAVFDSPVAFKVQKTAEKNQFFKKSPLQP